MTSVASQMLDELMGKYRNAMPHEKPPEPKWDDVEVCKYYLVGFCPHELFTNTKSDLGPCKGVHDDLLREQYRKSGPRERHEYEKEFVAFLTKLQNDMGRRIARNNNRLEVTVKADQKEMERNRDPKILEERIETMTETINELIKQAEISGADGRVDDAMAAIKEGEELKDERERLRVQINILQRVGVDQQNEPKQMEVCDICGCFLIVNDAPQRVDEHLTGKQHVGYAKIKETLDEFQRRKEEEKTKKDESRHKEKSDDKDKESAKHSSKSKDDKEKPESDRKSKSSRRSRSRDRKSRHKSRSRSRDRRRSRSRDRSKRDRSKDRRDRKERDRSRDRRTRRDRSRSRDKRRRSRSRKTDRKRSRSRSADRSKRSDRKRHRSRSRSKSRDRKSSKRATDADASKKKEEKEKEPSTENASANATEKSDNTNSPGMPPKLSIDENSSTTAETQENSNPASSENDPPSSENVPQQQQPDSTVSKPLVTSSTVENGDVTSSTNTAATESEKKTEKEHAVERHEADSEAAVAE